MGGREGGKEREEWGRTEGWKGAVLISAVLLTSYPSFWPQSIVLGSLGCAPAKLLGRTKQTHQGSGGCPRAREQTGPMSRMPLRLKALAVGCSMDPIGAATNTREVRLGFKASLPKIVS